MNAWTTDTTGISRSMHRGIGMAVRNHNNGKWWEVIVSGRGQGPDISRHPSEGAANTAAYAAANMLANKADESEKKKQTTLDWKRTGDGSLCAAAGMFHLRVWKRLSEDWKFTVTNPIGDFYEGVRPDEALAIADAHHTAELLSGGAL